MKEYRAALGRIAAFGAFYNARDDQFLAEAGTALRSNSQSAISKQRHDTTEVYVNFEDSYTERAKLPNIPTDLAASICSGLVKPQGCNAYLATGPGEGQALTASLVHTLTTVKEDIESDEIVDSLDASRILSCEAADATHIVIGIEWGTMSRVVLRSESSLFPTDTVLSQDEFRGQVQLIRQRVEHGGKASPAFGGSLGSTMRIVVESDNQDGRIIMTSIDEALQFLDIVPLETQRRNQGKGVPLVYTLLSIQAVGFLIRGIKPARHSIKSPPLHILSAFFELFDRIHGLHNDANAQKSLLFSHHQFAQEDHLQAISNAVHMLEQMVPDLQMTFGKALQAFRSGKIENALSQVYDLTAAEAKKWASVLIESRKQNKRLEFIASMVAKGAIFVEQRYSDDQHVLDPDSDVRFYVLRLNAADMDGENQRWKEHQDFLTDLLDSGPDQPPVFLAHGRGDTIRLAMYQGTKEICNDVLEYEGSLAGKCFAECPEEFMELAALQRPLQRRFIKIACPGENCDKHEEPQWFCPRCGAMLEFGFTDQYIYCDCGRGMYSTYSFTCHQRHVHGPDPAVYTQEELEVRLASLDVPDNVNILILGETGVGKSTFINAFVNYMKYEKLEDAQKHELTAPIPCYFNIQEMNRKEANGEIKQHHINFGDSRVEEHDGTKGESATQKTTVYPVAIGSRTVRLIDTPGIGDTRGVAQDKLNMVDILKTPHHYPELHGIIILLKSSNSRLNVTFNFCIQELLTHLHKSAAQSVAFGFTSTRVTNYSPGDTFGPLKTILNKHSDSGLRLLADTAYCFDSEAFRYLAAAKQGHEMDNFPDFSRSWEHSRKETQRLINHFTSRPPHLVKETISLNRARSLIQELTKPMADVAQIIQRNLDLTKNKTEELKDQRLQGKDLLKRLVIERLQFSHVTLPQPRTVCKNQACCEVKDDGTGENSVVTIFKSHCHAVCFLPNVPPDQVANPGLIHCAAFGGQDNCHKCNHHWQEHMHVLVELKGTLVKVQDTGIQKQLSTMQTDAQLHAAALQQLSGLTRQYPQEHDEIRNAAAYFCLFLMKHSITAYNDATLAYLDMHIKDEQSRIALARQRGLFFDANERRLAGLEDDRRRHQELVKTMADNQAASGHGGEVFTETDVDRRIQVLYQLKYFGKDLENIKNTFVAAHEGTIPERPVPAQGAVPLGCWPGGRAGNVAKGRITRERDSLASSTEKKGRFTSLYSKLFSDGRRP